MNPFIDLGFFSVRTYTALVAGTVIFGLGVLVYAGYRQKSASVLAWLDVGVLGVVGGVFGARLLHVLLTWVYFQNHLGEAFSLRAGGLNWHGALYGGLLGIILGCRWRKVSFSAVADVLAWLLPPGMMAVWAGCWASSCAYGVEVWTLADYPAWAVSEQADVFGLVVPRYNVQQFGLWLGAAIFGLVALMTWAGLFRNYRLWLVLALMGVGQFGLGFYRGDGTLIGWLLSLTWDQALDLSVISISMVIAGATFFQRRQKRVRDA